MANGGRHGGGGLAGNLESPQYARLFDPGHEQEHGSLFLEEPDIQRAAQQMRQAEDAQEAAKSQQRSTQNAVHFVHNLGKFIIPEQNTWAAHAEIVRDEASHLHFDPKAYAFFDAIIAKKFPAVMKPEYEGLRTNLEVLRNDIIGFYLKDGSFDPGDEAYAPFVASIASAIGEGLARDTWWKRPFWHSIDVDVANVESVGAGEMYKYLLSVQDNPAPLVNLKLSIKQMLGLPPRAWGLPPIEETPFSPQGLSAPPPPHKQCFSEGELAAACSTPGQFAQQVTNRRTDGPKVSL